MRFKVGDKVKIRKDLIADRHYDGTYFNGEMPKYCGETATIMTASLFGFRLDIDDGEWEWSNGMLEEIVSSVIVPIADEDAVATYYTVEAYTIAVPKGCAIGFSKRCAYDTDIPIVGQGIALKRMLNDAKEKKLI